MIDGLAVAAANGAMSTHLTEDLEKQGLRVAREIAGEDAVEQVEVVPGVDADWYEEISPELMNGLKEEIEINSRVFQYIGQFIFAFSQLEYSIKVRLAVALRLTEEQLDVVISPYDFAMLCTVTQNILIQIKPSKDGELQKLFNKCRKLNEERVKVAHGLWTPGPNGPMARHVSRAKLKHEYHFEHPEKLATLAENAKVLMAEVFDS